MSVIDGHPLEMEFSGDRGVVEHILKKRELLSAGSGDHAKIKTVLILPGGGQRGVIEGGAVVSLEKLDLVDAFDYVLGMSTGAAVGYYTLGREAAIGSTIYFDDNVKNHFVNKLRLWKIMDIDSLERVFRTAKPIDIEVFKNSRPKFLVSLTDRDTGKGMFVDAKSFDDPLSCVVASVCVPIVDGGRSVLLNDKLYIDGALSNPLAIRYAIETLGATDILVVLTDPLVPKKPFHNFILFLINTIFTHMVSPGIRSQILTFIDRYNDEQKFLTGEKTPPPGVHIGVIHPKHMPIRELTMDKQLLEKGVLASMAFTEKLFHGR